MDKLHMTVISAASILWLTGQRDIFKFAGEWAIPISVIYALILIFTIGVRPLWWRQLCQNRNLIFALFALTAGFATVVIYPYADGLKEAMRGSDQDDAVLMCAQALLRGEYPYLQRTYFGNPASPAPGMLLLFLPSAMTGWYPLTTLAALGATIFYFYRQYGGSNTGEFVALVSLSLLFWDHLAVGSDLIVLGLMVLVTTDLSSKSTSLRNAIIIGLLSGVLGATRTVFAFIPLMYGFILFQRSKIQGMVTGLIGTLITMCLHGIFLLWDHEHYSPLHLFGKGDSLLAGYWKSLAIILVTLVGIYLIALRSPKSGFAYKVSLLTLGTSLGILALASLFTFHQGNFALWEGANYLMPMIPTLIFYLVLQKPELDPQSERL